MQNEQDSDGSENVPPRLATGPIEMAPDCWSVGHRNPAAILQCNTYVRKLRSGGIEFNLCVDPGSQFDFAIVEANVNRAIGGLSAIDGMTINHQDPDVVGNVPYICQANPRVEMFVSEEVWRLLQHMLVKPGSIRLANVGRSEPTKMTPQHRWDLVPTPFCHFRGAMAFYDPEIRTLFSGDLFGGFNRVGAVHLFASEEDWPGIVQFHQLYMPSREVLRYAVRQILSLNPPVRVIAPQHGHIITGNLVPLFLERMYDMLVGHDLLADAWDGENLEDYRQVIVQLISRAELSLGTEEVFRRLATTDFDDQLECLLRVQGHEVRLLRDGYSAVVKVFSRLTRHERLEFVVALRSLVLNGCSDRGLAIPPVGAGLDMDGGGPTI